jgi:DNA-binding NarL/FixJ family response regulator
MDTEETGPGRHIRILIVDDHPVVRNGLRAMLDAPGIEVLGRRDGGAAGG